MPPKRKAPSKKKESPPPSESEIESEEEDLESESESEPESPKPKKRAPAKPKAPPKPKAAPAPKKTKAAPVKKEPVSKKETRKAAPKAQEAEKPAPATLEKKLAAKSGSKQLVIEHCKQCNSFKQRALKIQELVKASVPEVEITINPEKPRKGCFEIREAGPDGKVFLSLTGLVRPFPKLKALDLDETAQDVIAQIT